MAHPLNNLNEKFTPKSFWERPEGATGGLFAMAIAGGLLYLLYKNIDKLVYLASQTLYLVLMLLALGAILYVLFDPKFRNLIWFVYKSIMRWLTGLFVKIDPIGILESYIDSMRSNLKKMGTQIESLRGQMRKLNDIINQNNKIMEDNLALANQAKDKGKQNLMILKTRKAGRLQESNMKLSDLYRKMEVLYKILLKMHETSEILLEDVKDQVEVKKMEREAIRTSHSAIRSAMSIISGDSDKRLLFDQAMEAIADDVSRKVGEMEHFMQVTASFIDSVDLQNGIYEEKGLEMLEKWEKEGISWLLGEQKQTLLNSTSMLDIQVPNSLKKPGSTDNEYNNLFN
jgi:phage shock protein A